MTNDAPKDMQPQLAAPEDWIDAVADSFEAAWRSGKRPEIAEFLQSSPNVESRRSLLRELICLDVLYRLQYGETPQPVDYLAQFTEVSPELIDEILVNANSDHSASSRDPIFGISARPNVFPIRCPHCHNAIRVLDEHAPDVVCPSCGSSITVRNAGVTTLHKTHRLGKFELLDRVGRGAFGEVWRAKDTQLDRIVAIKIPHGGVINSVPELERFQREARIAAQLRHPGIVAIHEITDFNGVPAIVSDFVFGVPLQDQLEVGMFAFRETAQLVAEIADAIEYAHSMGAIHRDLKPSNIMLERSRDSGDGSHPGHGSDAPEFRPKVMDFGLALRVDAEITMTIEGQILGTPAYMSPEQAAGQGHRADARSDIYSLGVVLYQMLCGQLPFRGSKLMLIDQVLHEEPQPPRKFSDKIPRDLETIALKAMNKSAQRRYQSARELADDLRRWLRGEVIQARPTGRLERAARWCRRYPVVTTLTAAVFLLMISVAAILFVSNHRIRKEKGLVESQRQFATEALVDALLTARPEAVPEIVGKLKALAKISRHILEDISSNQNAPLSHQIRAACALSAIGDVQVERLIAGIPSGTPAECANIAEALRPATKKAIDTLRKQLAAESPETQFRIAAILWDLQDVQGVEQILSLNANRSARTEFIHSFGQWCWRPAQTAELFPQLATPDARSGLCLAIAMLGPQPFSKQDRATLAIHFSSMFAADPNPAVHSAAGWALRKWQQTLPNVEPRDASPAGRDWFTNKHGITMLLVPMDEYSPATRALPGFYMSDREISIAQFAKFIRDSDLPGAEKPLGWELWRPAVTEEQQSQGAWGPKASEHLTSDCPIVGINIFDAILFCNWLSHQDGREACYRLSEKPWLISHGSGEGQFTVDGWFCDFKKNGYRLPTLWEWRNATSSRSFPYHFGTNSERLPFYAWFKMNADSHSHACGAVAPSPWGFFDTFGNATEICWERSPTGWFALGGGDWTNDHQECSLATAFQGELTGRGASRGMRIVCTDEQRVEQFQQQLSDRKERVRAHPDSMEFKLGLADTYEELGTRAREAGKYDEAVESYNLAIGTLASILELRDSNPAAGANLLEPYEHRARLLHQMDRHTDALNDWLVIVDLQPSLSASISERVLAATKAVALGGNHELAATAADSISRSAKQDNVQLYNAACAYCWCINALDKQGAGDSDLAVARQRYFSAAIDRLRESLQHGWNDTDLLRKDPDLDVLRSSEQFQQLMQSIAPDEAGT